MLKGFPTANRVYVRAYSRTVPHVGGEEQASLVLLWLPLGAVRKVPSFRVYLTAMPVQWSDRESMQGFGYLVRFEKVGRNCRHTMSAKASCLRCR